MSLRIVRLQPTYLCFFVTQRGFDRGFDRDRGSKVLSALAVIGTEGPVVYLPTCVTRTMGPARGDENNEPVHAKLLSIFDKA
eukprot:3203090-Pyramimonas_sp.AAC.1